MCRCLANSQQFVNPPLSQLVTLSQTFARMSAAAFISTSGYLPFTRRVTRRYVVSLHGCHSVKYRSGHSRHLFQYCSVIHLLDLSQILGQSFRFVFVQITSRSNNVEGTLADVWQNVKNLSIAFCLNL